MSWYQAKTYCRSKYTDLASIRSISEYENISILLTGEGSWFGLHRKPWSKWSDSSNRKFTDWAKGQPRNFNNRSLSCVWVNSTTGQWYDARCTKHLYFICQKITFSPSSAETPDHHKTIRLKMQSEADLTEPAIQHQILRQVKKSVKL